MLPHFEDEKGVKVKVVAVGTGQALNNAANCNGDIVIVHSPRDEEVFVADGLGISPYDLMYNQFVIVGPSSDPANIRNAGSIDDAFSRLLDGKAPFVSRGDDSGTHKKELEYWASIKAQPKGDWYLEVGSGMGATLNITVGINGYTLTDQGTWLNFGNKHSHEILFGGGKELFNQYGIILVASDHCPNVKDNLAAEFLEWMVSPKGQRLIADYKIDGKQLFFPNAQQRFLNSAKIVE